MIWNDRELSAIQQFIVTQKPWRIRYIDIFRYSVAFSYRNIHLIFDQIRSDHLIDLLCIGWTKCFNSKTHTLTRIIHLYGNGVIHLFIHSWYQALKSIRNCGCEFMFGHIIMTAFYTMRFKSKSISIQVHTRARDCKQKHSALFINTW